MRAEMVFRVNQPRKNIFARGVDYLSSRIENSIGTENGNFTVLNSDGQFLHPFSGYDLSPFDNRIQRDVHHESFLLYKNLERVLTRENSVRRL